MDYLYGLLSNKVPPWGSSPDPDFPNPCFDPLTRLPALAFGELCDASPDAASFLLDRCHFTSTIPDQDAQTLIRACVALVDDLKITAAHATSNRLHSVLFVGRSHLPIVFDTGASMNLSPDVNDFVHWEREGDCGPVDGLTGSTRIMGIGTVRWTLRADDGTDIPIETQALYVPGCNVKLLSPQVLFRERQSGSFTINCQGARFTFPNLDKTISFRFDKCNLPVARLAKDEDDLEEHSFPMDIGLDTLCPNNLSLSQVERLRWHQRIGHYHLGWLQRLMRPRGKDEEPVLKAKHSASSCPLPRCEACLLGKQMKRPTGASIHKNKPETEGALSKGDLQPGDRVSVDLFECPAKGRLPNTFGKEKDVDRYSGGAIYVDHASGLIFTRMQVALTAGDTIRGKNEFE